MLVSISKSQAQHIVTVHAADAKAIFEMKVLGSWRPSTKAFRHLSDAGAGDCRLRKFLWVGDFRNLGPTKVSLKIAGFAQLWLQDSYARDHVRESGAKDSQLH